MSEDIEYLEGEFPFKSLVNNFKDPDMDFDTYANDVENSNHSGWSNGINLPEDVRESYHNTMGDLEAGAFGSAQYYFSYFSKSVQDSVNEDGIDASDMVHLLEHAMTLYAQTRLELTAAKQKIADLEAMQKPVDGEEPKTLFIDEEIVPFKPVIEALTESSEDDAMDIVSLTSLAITHPKAPDVLTTYVEELDEGLLELGSAGAFKVQEALINIAAITQQEKLPGTHFISLIEGLSSQLFADRTL